MKSRVITILLCLMPIYLFAQNYEKEGDELFAQGKYEQAYKKYSAFIAAIGESQSVKQKQTKCTQCQTLLTKAQNAEQSAKEPADYERASKLYSDLYAIHPLPIYKEKATALKNKAASIIKQRQQAAEEKRLAEERAKVDVNEVYQVVETMPQFQGGTQAMFKYIEDNLKCPDIVNKKSIQGKAICRFIVEKDGSISNVEVVISSGNPSLDNEAVRVINAMPKWTPGMQKGLLVRVRYTLPIKFNLK